MLGLSFAQGADSRSLKYVARIVIPQKISVTASVGLGQIGSVGIPMSFDVPNTPIAEGAFPLLLSNQGKFELPDKSERSYSLVMTPTTFKAGAKGILAEWKSKVEFSPPGP